MNLTAENVSTVFMDCLFRDEENKSNPVLAEAILSTFGFHPERLESHRNDIKELLAWLPTQFREGGNDGGGWSFLNACMTREGDQWGEHRNIEQLLALGIATGQAKILMPRQMWSVFPGGMPYFSVKV